MIDITQVCGIVQDFTNKRIRVLSKQTYVMWEQTYTSNEAFNKAFREMSKKFYKELERREKGAKQGVSCITLQLDTLQKDEK